MRRDVLELSETIKKRGAKANGRTSASTGNGNGVAHANGAANGNGTKKAHGNN